MLRTRPKPYVKPEREPRSWPGVQRFAQTAEVQGMGVAVPKTVEKRNPHLLTMARNQRCLLNVQGVCNHDNSTSVACHSNFAQHGKSKARKADDQYTATGCSACHQWLDQGRASKPEKEAVFMTAHFRQVLEWRRIASGPSSKDQRAAQWALDQLNATHVTTFEGDHHD